MILSTRPSGFVRTFRDSVNQSYFLDLLLLVTLLVPINTFNVSNVGLHVVTGCFDLNFIWAFFVQIKTHRAHRGTNIGLWLCNLYPHVLTPELALVNVNISFLPSSSGCCKSVPVPFQFFQFLNKILTCCETQPHYFD